ncbi:RNA polymerase II mediator complex subunit [Dissophora globulifera]|nr:RNA polymerase II mediator complex subunit [Dissophora globulifera]
MSKYPGHHTTNHPRGAFPPYPPGSGGAPVGPGGVPMNNVPGQGSSVPGRMGFSTGRNIVPSAHNYHSGGNSGPGGPGGPGPGYPGGFPNMYGSSNSGSSSNSQMPFGVFPQRSGQDEDQMTSNNVKTGYMDKGIIQNETVSAQGILADGLQDPKKLHDLGAFMVEVLKRRQESSRITGVPHGFKSEKLLETLAQRQVPMLRATWYIKIVALSEMQSQRSRPATQHQYSTDWTIIVNAFLKKQLLEINPHSTAKPAASALNPASGAQNVKPWTSEEAKEKWESKWRYSVMLTKWQYNEGLLDHRHFLRSTVEQLPTLGFEQVALLLSLISMFLSEYARSRLLMRLLIEGLLNTLQSVQRHPSYNQPVYRYAYLELELKRMLQSIFLSTPDMFVIPKVWTVHSNLLRQVLLEDIQAVPLKPAVFPNVGSVLESHYKMIHARVQVFTDLTQSSADADIQLERLGCHVDILDKLDHTSDLEQAARNYFAEMSESYSSSSRPSSPSKPGFSPSPMATSSSIAQPTQTSSSSSTHIPSSSQRSDSIWRCRVNTLCEWAITTSRYGHHRVYLAGTLLNIWRDDPSLSPRVPLHERTTLLQGALLEFLDNFNGTHHQASHHQDIGHGHHQHHSHGSEDALDAMARLFDAQAHHINQRRVVLFGVNGEDEYDRECFETITAQIKAKLPHMFSPESANMTVPIKDSPQDVQNLSMPLLVQLTELILSASRFCQLRITSQWLLVAVQSYVVKHIQIGEDNWRVMTSPGSSLLNVRQFATIVNVMEVVSDFHSLYETCIWLLDHTSDKALLTHVVNVAKKHYMVWAAMGVLTQFSQAILAKHYNLQGKNILFKALPRYLAFEAPAVPEDIRTQANALRKLDAASRGGLDDAMNGGTPSLTTATLEIVRASRLYAELLVEMAERVGSGCMNEVVLSWLRLHDLGWMTSVLGETSQRHDAGYEGQPIWFLSFMVQLVIQGFCSIEVLVQDMCGSVLGKVAGTIQEALSRSISQGDHLDDMHHQHHQHAAPDEPTLRLCMTMVLLLRMLLLEDAFSSPRAAHAYGSSHHVLSLEQHTQRSGIPLTIAEIHALQTQRYSRLMVMQQQSRRELDSEDTEGASSSSLVEQRVMLVQFQICRDLVWIESCLPLNHRVLHEIHEYRRDWALSADWLREKCLSNVDGAYKMFLQTRQEHQSDSTGNGASDDSKNNSATNTVGHKQHFEMVDRKMMETFQMLVAESHESLLLMDTYGDAALTSSMVHQRTFRSIFSRVDRWIFDRCKVEFWLLLDNVMMERSTREKRAVGSDGSVLKDSATLGSSISPAAASLTSDGLMMMEGVTLGADTRGDSQPANAIGMAEDLSATGADEDSLQRLIHIFFQEFVLSETADKELLGRMLIGMRSDAVEEFIRYGYSILIGSSEADFPYNVMIVQRPVSSADYIKIVANFHYVMEVLIKEGQSGLPLSLSSDETSCQSTAAATPSASTPSSINNNSGGNSGNNAATSVLQGLDATQLENRIGFAKSLLWQLKKFEDRTRVFDVMHAIGCSYEEASKVVQESESGSNDMEDLLQTASMQHSHLVQTHPHLMADTTGSYQHQKILPPSMTDSSSAASTVHLIDLRTSLCLRLRLLVPLLPVILQHPSSTACDLTTYVIRLTNLLVSSIIHGQGSEERLFEFCLDMVSCLMDEVLLLSGGLSGRGADSKAVRNDILNQLRTGLPQMTMSIPTVFASRIFRILPFQQHNVYFTGLRASGDAGSKGHKEIQPRPWDWLEDCVGDVDQQQQYQQQQQPSQSPSLGLGLLDPGSGGSVPGVVVNGDVSSGITGSTSSLASSSTLGSSPLLVENTNDTSISLTFFGAKQIRKSTDGTTYQTQFKLGHGGSDDEQELILVEEQQRPCEYDHSHQQQLLMIQHQQKQEQLLLLQQQQQMLQKQQAGSMMEGGSLDGAPSSGGGNMMEMDLFGPGSSGGGIRSGSVPPLPRQQEPDPELEEGQILNDDDLDMNAGPWDGGAAAVSSINDSVFQQQPGQLNVESTIDLGDMEDGEVLEKEEVGLGSGLEGSESASTSTAPAASNVTAVPAVAVPSTSTSSTTSTNPTPSKKKSTSTSKTSRGAAASTNITTTAAATTAAAPTKTARTSKGSRSGKGSKSAQGTATAVAAAPTEQASTDAVTATSDSSVSADATMHFSQPSTTSVPLSQSVQMQQAASQPFQAQQPQQQYQTIPQHMFQSQLRASGGMQSAMPIALPPQGQPGGVGVLGGTGGLTSQQLMSFISQGQGGGGGAMTIGGIHVPFLNGQQGQQQQQQQQNQYMDPSAFLNNGNNGGMGFGAGNPMNIHLGHLNNNNGNNGNNGNNRGPGNNNTGNNNSNNNGGW